MFKNFAEETQRQIQIFEEEVGKGQLPYATQLCCITFTYTKCAYLQPVYAAYYYLFTLQLFNMTVLHLE